MNISKTLAAFSCCSVLTMGYAADPPPLVGAIRWDAWYSDKGPVKEVERTLGPPKYHFRLPWFAKILDGDKVTINGDTDAIIDQEINYAAQAGLNYWAFLDYGPASDMTHAFNRYLVSKDKKGVQFCFIEEGGAIDGRGPKDWPRVVEHFKSPDYVKVLGDRPLLFVFGKPKKYGREVFEELIRTTVAAGLKRPYLVLMGWNPGKDREKLGIDAVSEYAMGSYTMKQPPYAALQQQIQHDLWEKWERERTPCVTFARAGWDTRPRQERPPGWCRWIKAEPDNTPPEQQKPLLDAVTARPDEIAAHLGDALVWTRGHRDLNAANAIIIYGWNENDEGGWLIPSLGNDGRPDESRIKAISKVLRSK